MQLLFTKTKTNMYSQTQLTNKVFRSMAMMCTLEVEIFIERN